MYKLIKYSYQNVKNVLPMHAVDGKDCQNQKINGE